MDQLRVIRVHLPDSMIERLQEEGLGMHRRRDRPADDLLGACIGDERGVAKPCQVRTKVMSATHKRLGASGIDG